MKCPNCKKKGNDLRTLRTTANGRTVERQRLCPKCKRRADTIEIFKQDYRDETNAYKNTIQDLDHKLYTAKESTSEIQAAVATIVKFGSGRR